MAEPYIPLDAQIAELKREARIREYAYPRFVAVGRLSAQAADLQRQRLYAAITTLEQLRQATDHVRQLVEAAEILEE